jgi:hypothetical protein
MSAITRTERLFLLVFVLLNLALKLAWLGVNELAHDEPFTVFWSQATWERLGTMFRTENNPPLYFLLIKAWSALVPFEAAWLRFPSAVFSALAVWPLFLLARHLGSMRVAVLASILFTCSNYHYGFAHEVRAYSLFTLLTITGMWVLVRATESAERHGGPMRHMLHLSMLNVLLVYTHFFGWLVVGLQGLLVLTMPELRPLRRGFLYSAMFTMVWFLPYGLIFAERFSQSAGKGTWLTPPVPEELYNMVWRWSNVPVLAVGSLVLIAAACVKDRCRSLGMRWGLVWAFIPMFGMFAVSFVVPMFLDRYLVYAAPGFALLAALSVETIATMDRLRNVLATLIGLGMVVTFTPWKDNGLHPSRVVQQVEAWRSPGAPVLLYPWYYMHTYAWHADRDLLDVPENLQANLAKGFVYPVDEQGELPVDLGALNTLVLVVAANEVERTTALRSGLRSSLPEVDSVEADHKVWVYRFGR